MNRTHSHLYNWYAETNQYEFTEAITFEDWLTENFHEQIPSFEFLHEDLYGEKYYIWLEDITKGWFTIYKVNHSLTDYESDCPFCTGHFQEPVKSSP